MADKQSPLEKSGQQYRDQLLPKNKYNSLNTEPTDEASANKDANGIGENGTAVDQQTRQSNLKFNKYNDKNQYPDF
jgi:hypothetical protein